ncbi:TenA family protein [Wohlfahrtiimonas chitiniclastica]|uniref:TenA family protein n=1 Tax=Wohlfahrtiimonas chitiniclastica TaxID=400946 RepID=UPI001BCC6D83|nr:TenA family protein [Wohlfahrtiimonas chitiniclastica]MBS7818613.1 TenA family protein [Wohlfahrtiimonas chitiniclastica]MBS7826761.1 TenA family protein [Wohlfahrtiimonas chitiniclastica]
MGWSEAAWQAQLPVYETTKQLPFIQQLMKGTLAKERFAFYIEQDALYLRGFSTVLLHFAQRMDQPRYQRYFEGFVAENMAGEKALHDQYLTRDLSSIAASETLIGFLNFYDQLCNAPIEIALAGILPCFIVYQRLGQYIYANHARENNPYTAWIDMYAGIEHAESVRQLREVCDDYGAHASTELQQAMMASYREGCLWDQRFWVSCYELGASI